MGTEYGIRRIFQIRFRIIANFCHNLFLIVAGPIAMEGQLQPAPSLGIGCQGLRIVSNLRSRYQALQCRQIAAAFRRIELAAHGPDVSDGTANLFRRTDHHKIIPGLQKD